MITLYTKDNCSKCKIAKMRLKKSNIEFEEINASGNEELLKQLRELSFKEFPVAFFDDEFMKVNEDFFYKFQA